MNLKLQYFLMLICLILIAYQCRGQHLRSRIVNGRAASIVKYPWQVMLKISRYNYLRGAGSLISPDWVLTAAHCTYGIRSLSVMLGVDRIWDEPEEEITSGGIFMHPNYVDSTKQNDIALIKLSRPTELSSKIQPIPLVSYMYKNEDFTGATAIITGYGYVDTDTLNPSEDLLFGVVTIISNHKCKQFFNQYVFETTICSFGSRYWDSTICDGDSGGPLIIRDRNNNYFQIGIVSFSASRACSNKYPAAYTRVTSYLDFIRKTTKLNLN